MYSIQGHNSVRIRQAKEAGKKWYAPHPPWHMDARDNASEHTLQAQAAVQRFHAVSERWRLRGALVDTGAKYRLNFLTCSEGFEGLPLDFDAAKFYRRFDSFSKNGRQRREAGRDHGAIVLG